MSLYLWLLLLLVFLPYILGPILVRLKSTSKANPTFDEIPDEHARALFPQNFFALIREFEALGFSLVCHLSSTISPTTHSMISLLVNPSTKTFASVGFVRSLAATPAAAVSYIEFHTDFEDGSQLDTANSSTVRIFHPVPGKTQIKVPHLKDPSALYQVHLHLTRQRNVGACLPEPGTEKARFTNSVKQSLADQAELGFYALDEANQRYRLTWRGAFRSTYRLLWPMKQIHQRRQAQEGRRIAAEASRSK